MTRDKEGGFTVIELMLFLGITGALFAALMIGVSSNVMQQQYRDTVYTYVDFLQNQYSEVSNTRNERDDKWDCKSDGSIHTVSGSVKEGKPRGTTDCVLLGRYIKLDKDESGNVLARSGSVVGLEPTETDNTTSDIEALKSYKPKLTDYEVSDNSFINTTLSLPNKEPSKMSVLILRSPISGIIRVFASQNPFPENADLSTVINSDNAKRTVKVCVVGETGSLPIMSVAIDATVSGLNGVLVDQADKDCNNV